MKNFLESSRHVVLMGIAGTFLSSVALFLFGFAGVVSAIIEGLTASDPFGSFNLKEVSIILIQTIDIFLLATVFYIIALGLYELFIDDTLKLPEWLTVHKLEDLKTRLLGITAVILPITFLGKLVEWKQGIDILWLGLAVAAVLVAIASMHYVEIFKPKK